MQTYSLTTKNNPKTSKYILSLDVALSIANGLYEGFLYIIRSLKFVDEISANQNFVQHSAATYDGNLER
jgi:hypothetical protein